MMIKLTLEFASFGELNFFVKNHNVEIQEPPEMIEKVNEVRTERRGSKIKELHAMTKEYRINNQNKTYKECLTICGELIKKK